MVEKKQNTEQAKSQRINSQVKGQPSKRTACPFEAWGKEKERMKDWDGGRHTHDRNVDLMVCSFLNKKTAVIPDKMWEFHWDLGESSGKWEQSCDRSLLPFEPMVSELQSLLGNFDHLIPMIQFMYYVVTIQIGISALWVLAKFSWIPWGPKPLTITITYCKRSQKTETQKSEMVCPVHSEFSSWSRIET